MRNQNDVLVKCWCVCLYCKHRQHEEQDVYRVTYDVDKRFDQCTGCAVNSEIFCPGLAQTTDCSMRVDVDEIINMDGGE